MTKKLAALALAVALPALATAGDINPGALQLSGDSSFKWEKTSVDTGGTTDTTLVAGGLSAMYYVSQFLAFGLETEYSKLKVDDADAVSTFYFGPKAGIDYELMDHLSLFADGSVGVVRSSVGSESGDGFGLRIKAGFHLFLNPNASFDLFGQYSYDQAKFTGVTEKRSDIVGGVGLSIYLTNNPSNSERAVDRRERDREYR
jgi:hypothetical protein